MRFAVVLSALLLGGCTGLPLPPPGTPEYAAAQVSRGYDCGLRPDRQRILRNLAPDERRRFLDANARFAVRAYNAPRGCGPLERSQVDRELGGLARS